MPDDRNLPAALLVLPTLNEERHIGAVLETLLADPAVTKAVVSDGGSTDRTREIVAGVARRDARVICIDNPERLQSAGVNRAVEQHGNGAEFMIRADAHAGYPERFCSRLIAEAVETGAESVAVGLDTRATGGWFQRAVAAAQNSILGTGGSAHRFGRGGRWVDHGHHALFRLDAFRGIGGYDAAFSHNEDAEFDQRLSRSGGRIWLSEDVRLTYYPRSSPAALARQYWSYGRGRAANLLKHGGRPAMRQLLPLATPVAIILAAAALPLLLGGFAALATVFALPLTGWAALCLFYGAVLSLKHRDRGVLASGPAAMIMHAAWGAGYLWQLARRRR